MCLSVRKALKRKLIDWSHTLIHYGRGHTHLPAWACFLHPRIFIRGSVHMSVCPSITINLKPPKSDKKRKFELGFTFWPWIDWLYIVSRVRDLCRLASFFHPTLVEQRVFCVSFIMTMGSNSSNTFFLIILSTTTSLFFFPPQDKFVESNFCSLVFGSIII